MIGALVTASALVFAVAPTLHAHPVRGLQTPALSDASALAQLADLPHDEPRAALSWASLNAELSAAGEHSVGASLVYLNVDGRLELAWEIDLALRSSPVPSRQTRWIDAETGALLRVREHVVHARAAVYPVSPLETPTPVEVELSGLGAVSAGDALDGARYLAYGCQAEPTEALAPWRGYGQCYPTQHARADAAGDFFVALPAGDDARADDAYAELSAYYHAERFVSELLARGWAAFPCEQAILQANFTLLASDAPFVPFDNALFTGACADEGPMVILGQGAAVDYAHDADVIYHELGHGSVAAATPEGLWRWRCRSSGCSRDASALGEALADYHVAMITGDAQIGEAVAGQAAGMRDLDGERRCPGGLEGDIYTDSLIVSGALWRLREQLGQQLDALVLASLATLGADASFEEFALQLDALAATLDEPTRARVRAELERAGLFACERIVELALAAEPVALRLDAGPSPGRWPGPVQLRIPIDADVPRLRIEFELEPINPFAGGSLDDSVELALRCDGELVRFAFEGERVAGDWDELRVPVRVADRRYAIELEPAPELEQLHVALLNASSLRGVDLRVELLEAPTLAPSGCRSTRPPASPAHLALLLPLLLARRRRRRRR